MAASRLGPFVHCEQTVINIAHSCTALDNALHHVLCSVRSTRVVQRVHSVAQRCTALLNALRNMRNVLHSVHALYNAVQRAAQRWKTLYVQRVVQSCTALTALHSIVQRCTVRCAVLNNTLYHGMQRTAWYNAVPRCTALYSTVQRCETRCITPHNAV
eukprot:gene7132-biopygen2392